MGNVNLQQIVSGVLGPAIDGLSGFQVDRVRSKRILGRGLSGDQLRWIEDVHACHRWPMGYHPEVCPKGCHEAVRFHACRNRNCSMCRSQAEQVFIERWEAKVLRGRHFHSVISMASRLRALFMMNYKVMANAMFRAASQTFKTLYADPNYVGARGGFVVVLHTHNQKLEPHIHLHIISTDGGLDDDGKWVAAKSSILFPQRVIAAIYQKRFAAELQMLIEGGELVQPINLRTMPKNLGYKFAWRAKVMPRYETAIGGVKYFIRYARGGPIGNSRLLSFDGKRVAFNWLDRREAVHEPDGVAPTKTFSLPAVEFLNRLMSHIPPKRFHTFRSYGLYAGASIEKLAAARAAIGQAPRLEPKPVSFAHLIVCPVCGNQLDALADVASPLREHRQGLGRVRARGRDPPPVRLAA